MRTILLYLLSVALIATLAFFGGRLAERKKIAASEAQAPEQREQPISIPPKPKLEKKEEKKEPQPEPEVPPTAAELIQLAAAELGQPSTGQRGFIGAYELVGKLAPEEIGQALGEVEKMPHGEARQALVAAIISRWAETDGTAAMNYALANLGHANRPAAVASALTSWADNDPSGALDWYHRRATGEAGLELELTLGTKPAYLLPTIFEGLAATDISAAYAAFSRLGSNEEKDQALDGIAEAGLGDEQTRKALDLAADTLAGAARSARLRLVNSWGKRSPSAAAEWVSTVKDPTEKSQFAKSVARSWIAFEPTTAVPWLLDNTPQSERGPVVELATSIWVHSDPNGTAEWLGTLPKGKDSDLGVSTLARNIVTLEPESALGWAKTIEEKNIRLQTMIAVISQWRVREPERAVEALRASGLDPKELEFYLGRTKPAGEK